MMSFSNLNMICVVYLLWMIQELFSSSFGTIEATALFCHSSTISRKWRHVENKHADVGRASIIPVAPSLYLQQQQQQPSVVLPLRRSKAFSLLSSLSGLSSSSESTTTSSSLLSSSSSVKAAFDAAVLNRYACKQFQRYDGSVTDLNNNNQASVATTTAAIASVPDPTIVQQAYQCLDLACRAPTGFNMQPYKMILVQSIEQKTAMAKYCCGPNAQRVRDADCTVVFLADRQVLRTLSHYLQKMIVPRQPRTTKPATTTTSLPPNNSNNTLASQKSSSPSSWITRFMHKIKLPFYIALFSSGYPLPRFISAPLSTMFRFIFYLLSLLLTPHIITLPTLSSSETWCIKNTMMVAMTYLLACTSRGLQTSPMEGFSAWGIRKVLNIPSRYAIPLIVATGRATSTTTCSSTTMDRTSNATTTTNATATTTHPPSTSRMSSTQRYPMNEMVFQDVFQRS